ncbi:MAG: S8 family serine peptidase [Bryobacteraceae bacterium]
MDIADGDRQSRCLDAGRRGQRLRTEGSGQPCDPRADAVENAIRRGLTVVVSAGNAGDSGTNTDIASLSTIASPATAPSAISVGATTNAQRYMQTVRVQGNAPAALREVRALFGDGPRVYPSIRGPVRDLAPVQDNGSACSPLGNGTLAGAIALVQRGGCDFAVKVNNAQKAGAIAVIVQQRDGSDSIFSITGLGNTGIPTAMIGSTAGKALQQYLKSSADAPAVLDPALVAVPYDADYVALFSSYGPSIGGGALKPEVAAVGDPLYMATQSFDPNGDMYSPDGFYTVASGTSFSAPMVAGAAAFFKQRVRNATPAQVKSAVVNTASTNVSDEENGKTIAARPWAVGAGKLNAADVASTNVTIEPATLSFGYIGNTFPISRALKINNHSNASLSLRIEVKPLTADRNARVTLSDTSFALGAGQSRNITVTLGGTRPSTGAYDGDIVITGGATTVHVPYLYALGDGVAVNAIPLRGDGFDREVGSAVRLIYKLVDQFGAPVGNTNVRFRVESGGGSIDVGSATTDVLGIAEGRVILGSQIGFQEFSAEGGGKTIYFGGNARIRPTISSGGVLNAASNQLGRGIAPGSYMAIFGRGLSDALKVASTSALPLALAGVSISFDVPERKLSLPGRLLFVSDGQLNVQVPWELQGINRAQMKVSIGDTSSDLFDVPLNDYAPAVFEVPDPSGRVIVAALDENFQLVTTQNPLRAGRTGQLYANGLGPVTNTPPTGEPTPADPLPYSRSVPTVTVGGRPAEVLFSGLSPFSVGLYQINIRLAPDTPTGIQPVVVTVEGVASKAVNMPVQ